MLTCSIFQNCTLNSIAEELPQGQHSINGAITAQGRKFPDNDTGFSFVGCTIQGSGNILLGRAWEAYSRVVFAYTYMPAIVAPEGWDNWGQENRNRFLLSIHFRGRLCFQLSCSSTVYTSIVLNCLFMDSQHRLLRRVRMSRRRREHGGKGAVCQEARRLASSSISRPIIR